jgi:hypothetical protein
MVPTYLISIDCDKRGCIGLTLCSHGVPLERGGLCGAGGGRACGAEAQHCSPSNGNAPIVLHASTSQSLSSCALTVCKSCTSHLTVEDCLDDGLQPVRHAVQVHHNLGALGADEAGIQADASRRIAILTSWPCYERPAWWWCSTKTCSITSKSTHHVPPLPHTQWV